ncbi:MAG TPA: biotin--[acetyl-CoA-carboxylase] ligase, partial [Acidimicrobiia bacterium]|nr:biotin--[acetyl-CoA-carboxylase] ligase [Acidimicrobiia bacterium]
MDTPYSVTEVEEVSSTQDVARARFTSGTPAVVIARRQTGGRGRTGTRWETAPLAVAVSVAFTAGWDPSRAPLVTLLAGVAAARVMGPEVRLKWPNDVLLEDSKVAGILVELSEGVFVAGLGVNLWWPQPPPGWGALYQSSPEDSAGVTLGTEWAAELLDLVAVGPDRWPRDEYRQRCATLGREIEWDPEGRGRAVGIAPDGALVVEAGDGRTTLASGAVRH